MQKDEFLQLILFSLTKNNFYVSLGCCFKIVHFIKKSANTRCFYIQKIFFQKNREEKKGERR